jgi:hypothetical protein
MGRKKFYERADEMQIDLDAYLVAYNTMRPHQCHNMNGRTPKNPSSMACPKTKNQRKKQKRKNTKKAA